MTLFVVMFAFTLAQFLASFLASRLSTLLLSSCSPFFWVLGVVESSGDVLREIRRHLERHGMASLSELERSLGVSRNWLSGFMAALEALGVVACKGTRTYKIYMLASQQQ